MGGGGGIGGGGIGGAAGCAIIKGSSNDISS
jgi:hypothetical protein